MTVSFASGNYPGPRDVSARKLDLKKCPEKVSQPPQTQTPHSLKLSFCLNWAQIWYESSKMTTELRLEQ